MILTDLESRLPLLHHNVKLNEHALQGSSVTVRELDWCSTSFAIPQCDFVIAIDCIYYSSSVSSLLSCIELLKPSCGTLCFYELRDIGEPQIAQKLFDEMLVDKFIALDIPKTDLDPDYICDDILALSITRKE